MLSTVSDISEKLGMIAVFRSLDAKPQLRRNNRIRSVHSSLKIESSSLSEGMVRSVLNNRSVIGPEKVAEKCVEAIASDKYDLVVCNFANCDMVGHTGIMEAAVKAVETVDACMGKIVAEVAKHPDTVLLVTADHGNADCMFDETGKVNTAHTTNPVPFAVCKEGIELENGRLADIAPTILAVMGLDQPAEMTGKSLIK